MDRRLFLFCAAASALALSGCAKSFSVEPDDMTNMVHLTPETAPNLLGVWKGTFTPMYGKGEGGEVEMNVVDVDRTLIRVVMTWTRNGEIWQQQKFTGAMSQPDGHYMLMSTHVMVHKEGSEHVIIADVLMSDGNWYRNRLSRDDVSFSEMKHG